MSAAGLSDVTNSLGCVVFANVPRRLHGRQPQQPRVRHADRRARRQRPRHGRRRQTTLVSEQYDAGGAVPVTFDTRSVSDPTVRAAQWRTVTASHSALLTPRLFGRTTDPLATQITATSLFPFTSGYTIFAASCAGNDPSTYQTNYFASNPGLMHGPRRARPRRRSTCGPHHHRRRQQQLDKTNARRPRTWRPRRRTPRRPSSPDVVISPAWA